MKIKDFLIGICVVFSGFYLCTFLTGFMEPTGETSYYYMIIWSILYLTGIVATSASIVISKLNSKSSN